VKRNPPRVPLLSESQACAASVLSATSRGERKPRGRKLQQEVEQFMRRGPHPPAETPISAKTFYDLGFKNPAKRRADRMRREVLAARAVGILHEASPHMTNEERIRSTKEAVPALQQFS